MAKKFKVKKINGVRIVTECRKDHDRAPCPSPELAHKSIRDYDRKRLKRETAKEVSELD